jgi:hypothetical protein
MKARPRFSTVMLVPSAQVDAEEHSLAATRKGRGQPRGDGLEYFGFTSDVPLGCLVHRIRASKQRAAKSNGDRPRPFPREGNGLSHRDPLQGFRLSFSVSLCCSNPEPSSIHRSAVRALDGSATISAPSRGLPEAKLPV